MIGRASRADSAVNASTDSITCSAYASSALPSAVSRTSRAERSKSRVPVARSSRVMAWLMAGWDIPRSAAAAEKLSRSATRVKQWISRSISSTNTWCMTPWVVGTIPTT
ncbi:hypothetical protein GCM10022224_051200 [Nonomuraea antimicrobica]|uniref:Homeodomain-like domain-containing protein n=1 Tax=Nonomuraea antimicrobica TaxID=561173 RepID=A0ABP7C5T2_9ACTN